MEWEPGLYGMGAGPLWNVSRATVEWEPGHYEMDAGPL